MSHLSNTAKVNSAIFLDGSGSFLSPAVIMSVDLDDELPPLLSSSPELHEAKNPAPRTNAKAVAIAVKIFVFFFIKEPPKKVMAYYTIGGGYVKWFF